MTRALSYNERYNAFIARETEAALNLYLTDPCEFYSALSDEIAWGDSTIDRAAKEGVRAMWLDFMHRRPQPPEARAFAKWVHVQLAESAENDAMTRWEQYGEAA